MAGKKSSCQKRKKTNRRLDEFELTAQTPARACVSRFAQNILLEARNNEEGIIRGDDIECLHRYRVCFRRVRALTGLLKQVYPPEIQLRLQSQLSELAAKTSELRNLDVFLSGWDGYVAMIPENFHVGMMVLFVDLECERRAAKMLLNDWLRSAVYRKNMASLQRFFERVDDVEQTAVSHAPVYPLAAKKIKRRYGKICRLADGLCIDAADKKFHQLRIECKKLRYLLNFFGDLYEPEVVKKLLKKLKKLQDILGEFNDFSVQQHFLNHYMAHNDYQNSPLAAGVELLSMLERCTQNCRLQIMPAINLFSGPATEKLVNRLLLPH